MSVISCNVCVLLEETVYPWKTLSERVAFCEKPGSLWIITVGDWNWWSVTCSWLSLENLITDYLRASLANRKRIVEVETVSTFRTQRWHVADSFKKVRSKPLQTPSDCIWLYVNSFATNLTATTADTLWLRYDWMWTLLTLSVQPGIKPGTSELICSNVHFQPHGGTATILQHSK
jgi:hypothetical protein